MRRSPSQNQQRPFRSPLRRKVIFCYPEWTSKEIFMGDIQRSGLDLVKVARDFDNLTLPEPSTNIVLRFTYYDDKSNDFAWKEKNTEDAVEDVNEDVDEEMGYEDEDEDEAEDDEYDKLHDPHFF
ncbi:hypothetical protein CMV_028605 [Castanea mollissima]|uniref:Uncharacterized protein n=1 Tax=Castanea mollissima TaxID=60419 RepID=A0A8J4Q862_9ROSI|nr:hypothetical protein CMV_028605 [Castanea mollissima]